MSKYKYSLTPEVKAMTELQIKEYPLNRKRLDEAKADMIPSAIPAYGEKSGASNPDSRPTEGIAIKISNSAYIRHLEWSVQAVGAVIDLLDDENRELIRLRYWNGALTPEGIADRLHIDRSTVYDRLNRILVDAAYKLGYIDL